jgi:N-acylneuraminate cytidylyltransferase
MKNLVIIPARGGSKRIPRKNIKKFLGKPIISYSIDAAIKSGIFDEIMVSTDDEEIANFAKKNGASIPFYRSKEMSSDNATTAAVLLEVLDKYETQSKAFDQVCCLYPCAPFVTSDLLKNAMEKLRDPGLDVVFPVVKFSYPPQRGLVIRNGLIKMLFPENYKVRSQDLEPYYHDAGQFYCIKSIALKKEQTLFCKRAFPMILSEREVQDIDTEADWRMAEIKYKTLNRSYQFYKGADYDLL